MEGSNSFILLTGEILNLNLHNEKMRKPICVLILLILICQSCAPRFPGVARDLAISAICDFPPLSGNNMCQRAEITRIVIDDLPDSQTFPDGSMRRWCVELNYVDYTGEGGFACIWLAGPNRQGDFLIRKGPVFDMSCPGFP